MQSVNAKPTQQGHQISAAEISELAENIYRNPGSGVLPSRISGRVIKSQTFS